MTNKINVMSQQLPQRIKEDFSDYYRTELHKHYLNDPSGLKLLLEIAKSVNSSYGYKNDTGYKEGQMLGFRTEFENNLEENLPWSQQLIVEYLDKNGIPSGQYRYFRKMAVEITLELLEQNI